MPNKTPKTQNQWAGFQVRECNDYNEATGICHHEETSVDKKGGLLGHHFPNNICKYFHRGRDGTAPRTFKQNISGGLINMDAVAEAILRQADKNIQEGKPYGGAAVREVHQILNKPCSSRDQPNPAHDHSFRSAASRDNYSKTLWRKIQENKRLSSRTSQFSRQNVSKGEAQCERPMHAEDANSVQGGPGNHYEDPDFGQESRLTIDQSRSSRIDDITAYESTRRQYPRYDGRHGAQQRRFGFPHDTSAYHGLHAHSSRDVYNYYSAYTPSDARALQYFMDVRRERDLYFPGSTIVGSEYDQEDAAFYHHRSTLPYQCIPKSQDAMPGLHAPPGSLDYQGHANIKNMELSRRTAQEVPTDRILDDFRFQLVNIDSSSGVPSSRGFMASVHFLKPPSSFHATRYWAQLWIRKCDEYNPRTDTCQHERKLWKCSFPEKACLRFHPGRNSERKRKEIISMQDHAHREFVAKVLITDCLESDFLCNEKRNPVLAYIKENKISRGTLIKNELPSAFTVRTVDLPFHWPVLHHSAPAQMLPEIVFISSSPLFREALLQPVLKTFGYEVVRCVKRRTNANEVQYFIWTSTRNAYYLKGLDSLFIFAPGKRPSLGIVVGDVTICPAERYVQPSERLRFLLIDEVANFRVRLCMPKGYALSRKLTQISFPEEWNFRSLIDDHKGLFRHLVTRSRAPEASIIRMNNHSIDNLTIEGSEYILYDRQLNEKELNISNKSLLLFTPAYHTIDDIRRIFHGMKEASVSPYDRQRSLNLNLLALYMRLLKYVAQRRRISVNEVQVIIIGGRTVEKSLEVNGIYKIFGANLSRPSHRVVTIRFKNEPTEDGYPRYAIGETAVSLSEVNEMLLTGQIGEVMEMVCLKGPTLIDACVADLPTVSTLQDQIHLLEDSTRLIILMSSEESWMSDLTAIQRLRNGNLDNMLVLVKTRNPREYFRTNFENQNIILFDRSETSHARHCLRLFLLSGIARHLIHMICHSNEKEDSMDRS